MKSIQLLAATVLFTAFNFAQTEATWQIELENDVEWQKVTSSGYLLVASANSMYSLNQDNGAIIWENKELVGYNEDQIQEVNNSPLFMSKKDGHVRFFSPFDGAIKFDSRKQGFSEFKSATFLPRTGGLLVSGKVDGNDQLVMVDVNDGAKRWSLDEKIGRIISVNEQNKSEFIVTTLFFVYKINSSTGNIVWKNSVSPDAAADNPLGQLFMDLAEEMTANMDFVIRYYQNLEKDKFVIAAEVKNETQTSDGKTSVSYRNNYTAFNLSDGKRVWNNPIEMKGKLGDLAFYKNGVIILPDDGNKTTINYYEFSTSNEGKWGKKGKGINIKGGIYSHVNTGEGFLLISKSGSNNFLNFLNPELGTLTFEKPVKISGEVQQTFITDKGILYITTEEVNAINSTTGEQLLEKSIITSPSLSQLVNTNLFAFDQKLNTIISLDIVSMQLNSITTEKLKFEGKENPTSLEVQENGILLNSEQNIALFTLTGDLSYQKYYPAPRESGMKRALLIAQAARATYIAAQAYSAAGAVKSATPSVKEKDAVSGAIVEGIGSAYEELGDQASDFAKKSFKQAQARFKASTQSRDFIVMFTTKDKENYLIKVDKKDGEIQSEISLGKEQQPKYALDDVTGKIFTLTGTKTMSAFDLNK